MALQTRRLPALGPLTTFPPAVAEAVLAYRRADPRLSARRAQAALQQDPALRGEPLPDWRTIHRAWIAAGLVTPRGRRTRAPAVPPVVPPVLQDTPPAVGPSDHQDGLGIEGLEEPVALQRVRAPDDGLTIGADVGAERQGADAVSEDAILGTSSGDRDHGSATGRPDTADRLDRPDVPPGHASRDTVRLPLPAEARTALADDADDPVPAEARTALADGPLSAPVTSAAVAAVAGPAVGHTADDGRTVEVLPAVPRRSARARAVSLEQQRLLGDGRYRRRPVAASDSLPTPDAPSR